jgi:hypothetical protein
MTDKNLPEKREYDSQKDLVLGISGMTIFAFFVPTSIALFLVFLGSAEAGVMTIDLAKLFGITIKQFSLMGSIVSLPIGFFGLYCLYLVASGRSQSNLISIKEAK